MKNLLKNKLFLEQFLIAITFLCLGIVTLVINKGLIATFIFIAIGVLMIMTHLKPFIDSCKNLKYKTQVAYWDFAINLIVIILGICLIFLQKTVSTVMGIILLIFALLDLFKDRDFSPSRIIEKLPMIILSGILIFFGAGFMIEVILAVIGYLLIIIGVVSIVSLIIGLRR